jgi:hypothetical protein
VVKSKLPFSVLLLAAIGPALYAAGLWAAALADGRSWHAAVCFNAALPSHLALPRVLAAVAMASGGMMMLWFTPWLLGILGTGDTGRGTGIASAPLWSLVGNSAALMAICLLLRHTLGISRETFLAAWLVWTGILLLLAQKTKDANPPIPNPQSLIPSLAIGLAVAALLAVLFCREHFLQCFNGDGTEFDQLARSLRGHFLPYWEIEPAGQQGTFVANPTVICSYWTFALQLLLGGNELPTRLPYWLWWLTTFAIALQMIQKGGIRDWGLGIRTDDVTPSPPHPLTPSPCHLVTLSPCHPWLPAIPLALLFLLVTFWYTFYVGYDPYMADVANPGVPDALFTLLLLLAFDCLRREDAAGWVAAMVCAALLFYAGLVMFVLMAAAALIWQPLPRPKMLRAIAAGAAILTGLALCYLARGWLDGSLAAWASCLKMEVTDKYFAAEPRWWPGLLFLGYFVLGSGGVPILGLVAAFRKAEGGRGKAEGTGEASGTLHPSSLIPHPSPPHALSPSPCHRAAWRRTMAGVTLAYLAIILGCGLKNLHYLGPLLPLPLILWLCGGRASRGKIILVSISLAVCCFLCWPRQRPIFTLNRQLGEKTAFQADSYEEACRWARIGDELYQQGLLDWQIGRHTWANYARWGRSAGRGDAEDGKGKAEGGRRKAEGAPLVVADAHAPAADYSLIFASPEGAKLYCRDPEVLRWLAEQRPLTGPERCPWVFQPIAIRPAPR